MYSLGCLVCEQSINSHNGLDQKSNTKQCAASSTWTDWCMNSVLEWSPSPSVCHSLFVTKSVYILTKVTVRFCLILFQYLKCLESLKFLGSKEVDLVTRSGAGWGKKGNWRRHSKYLQPAIPRGDELASLAQYRTAATSETNPESVNMSQQS